MKQTTTHQTMRGGAGCLILLFAMIATAYAFWKLGHAAGITDTHDSLFQTQWTSEAQTNLHAFEEQINAYRLSKKVKPLGSSPILEKTALDSAIAIFNGERGWDHNQFEASVSGQYKNAWIVGENLGRNYGDFATVFEKWKQSPGHNQNLLERDFCEIGIGVYRYVWVAHFGCRN